MTTHVSSPLAEDNDRLSLIQKLGYGVGDIYGGGAHIILNFYYLFFLTSVVRINPGLAGVVILISKVYDAITDPLEGVLTDRTRTRWGRRRPYLVAGILLVFLSFFGLFYPFNAESEAMRFAMVLLTYLFFSTVFSIVKMNYDALQSEMTLEYDERSTLSGFRITFSTLASIICAVLPPIIVEQFNDVYTGYIAMGLFFGVFFALPFIIVVATMREREEFWQPPQPFSWYNTFVMPFKMRAFVHVLLSYLFAFVAADIVSSIVIFFMKYYIGRGGEANYVNGTLLVVQVFSLPFYVWLSKRTSKRTAFITGASVWMAIMLFSFLLTPELPTWAIYVFAAGMGCGTGGVVVMSYAMFPDIPDIDELQTGDRREATYYAMIGFVRKLSSAVALFAVSQALYIGGFVAPVESVVDGATQLIEQPQSDTFILILRVMFAVVPIILAGLSIYFAARYPLNGEVHDRLKALLAKRRAGEPETSEMTAEATFLQELLIGEGASTN